MPFQGQLRPGAEEAVGHRLIREFTITPYKPSPKPPKVRESQILGTTSHIPLTVPEIRLLWATSSPSARTVGVPLAVTSEDRPITSPSSPLETTTGTVILAIVSYHAL